MPNIVLDNPSYIPLKYPILISPHLSALGKNLCSYLQNICGCVINVVSFIERRILRRLSTVLSNIDRLYNLHSAICRRFGKRFAKETMLKFLLVLFAALALIEATPTRRHVSHFLGLSSLLAISLAM